MPTREILWYIPDRCDAKTLSFELTPEEGDNERCKCDGNKNREHAV